jgi:hypothetical protein
MRKLMASGALAAFAGPPALNAQCGLALEGSYVFNQSKISDARQSEFDEVALGRRLQHRRGIRAADGHRRQRLNRGPRNQRRRPTTSFAVIGETNNFARLPMIRCVRTWACT